MRAHTTPRSFYAALAVTLLLSFATAAQSQQKPDAATAAWWAQTVALSNDSMEGRDTGTKAYERAANYVADQFKAADLKPAGDNNTFFQRVPMHQIDLDKEKSSVEIFSAKGRSVTFRFTTDITTVPREQPSHIEAPLIFVGYGMPPADLDLKGKIAVFFNRIPPSVSPADRTSFGAGRLHALAQAGVAAILSIDNSADIEPFHWPAAYARSVTIAGAPAPNSSAPIVIRVNPASVNALFAESAHTPSDILTNGGKGAPLATFPLNVTAHIALSSTDRDISSPNILAIPPAPTLNSPPNTSPSQLTSTATATALPSSATTSTTAPSTTQPTSRSSSN